MRLIGFAIETSAVPSESNMRGVVLDPGADWATRLCKDVAFEPVGRRGREAAVFVRAGEGSLAVPLVRTSTAYSLRRRWFTSDLCELCAAIGRPDANVALVERYSCEYSAMGPHSDMALDLDPDSVISLFTCYEPAVEADVHFRNLAFYDKTVVDKQWAVPLRHNAVVNFLVHENARMRHAILPVRAAVRPPSTVVFVGVTLYKAKTFIDFDSGCTLVPSGKTLRLATTTDEQRDIWRRKGVENFALTTEEAWGDFCRNDPDHELTISPADLLMPAL